MPTRERSFTLRVAAGRFTATAVGVLSFARLASTAPTAIETSTRAVTAARLAIGTADGAKGAHCLLAFILSER
jgi:hypothetical protein